jgi:UDPglucose--hexose-1-phosphate uridylyltransferase
MINKTVEKLLYYSQRHLGLEQEDYIFYRNLLLNELSIDSPFDGEIDKSEIDSLLVPDLLVDELSSHLLSIGLNEKEIEAKISKIFGLLTPVPSKVIERFNSLSDISSELGTNYLFNLGIKSNYIQKTKINSNIVIPGQINGHDLIMTINLSKPEKNNKDIKAALNSGDSNYPMCPICITNEGCIGSKKTQPRVNLRIIPLELSNNTWYLQYSPYGYYNEHCILILKYHVPMKVDIKYISAMFEFCDKFPHYFIGANSDLPIVGGSILSHEHFQGGNYELPMLKAGIKYSINTNTDD